MNKKTIKKNKPLIVFGVILCILVIVIIIMCFNNDRTDRLGNMDIELPVYNSVNPTTNYITSNHNKLIEYSYSNYAWSYDYYGEVVMENGDIFTFNCNDKKEYNPKNCLIRKIDTISKDDLEKIKSYKENIIEKYDTKNIANDYGEVTISMVKNDIEIVLIGKGDNIITNSSKDIKKMLKLLKKYKIYV